jgi:hypothetical protein
MGQTCCTQLGSNPQASSGMPPRNKNAQGIEGGKKGKKGGKTNEAVAESGTGKTIMSTYLPASGSSL